MYDDVHAARQISPLSCNPVLPHMICFRRFIWYMEREDLFSHAFSLPLLGPMQEGRRLWENRHAIHEHAHAQLIWRFSRLISPHMLQPNQNSSNVPLLFKCQATGVEEASSLGVWSWILSLLPWSSHGFLYLVWYWFCNNIAFFRSVMTGIEIDQGDYFDLVTVFAVLCTYELAEVVVIIITPKETLT
jgi:hypothetical protein